MRLNIFSGENPEIFPNGGCYLEWIAQQYEMVAMDTNSDCDKTRGDLNDSNKTHYSTDSGQ